MLEVTMFLLLPKISLMGPNTGLIMIPKKLVSTSKLDYVSVSNKSVLQINLILTSPNLVLTFYTYKVSNKKVSS
jgi:hypothetical protein